jgi:hypothetical protein
MHQFSILQNPWVSTTLRSGVAAVYVIFFTTLYDIIFWWSS